MYILFLFPFRCLGESKGNDESNSNRSENPSYSPISETIIATFSCIRFDFEFPLLGLSLLSLLSAKHPNGDYIYTYDMCIVDRERKLEREKDRKQCTRCFLTHSNEN